jgi:ATP-dependent DNA ligase
VKDGVSGSQYEAGKRSGTWVKIKLHLEQEFVIGGYTDPEGGRKHFGALLVGLYEGKRLKIRRQGRNRLQREASEFSAL